VCLSSRFVGHLPTTPDSCATSKRPASAAVGPRIAFPPKTSERSISAQRASVDRERKCISHSPGTPRAAATPARPGARRPQGRRLPAGALVLRGVSCSLPPCAFVPWFHTGSQVGRRPATCMYAFRPLRACAPSTPGHGHRRGTHTPRLRSSRSCPRAAEAVCARQAGRPSCVLSLTHTLTVACVASDMPVTWALGRRADGRADACAPVCATPMKKPATDPFQISNLLNLWPGNFAESKGI